MVGRKTRLKNFSCRRTTRKRTRVTIAAPSGMPAKSDDALSQRTEKDANGLRNQRVGHVVPLGTRRVEDVEEEQAERRIEHVLLLGREARLDVRLEAPQEERPQDRVQRADEARRARRARRVRRRRGQREPVLERVEVREEVRQHEVEQRPQLGEVVLRARECGGRRGRGRRTCSGVPVSTMRPVAGRLLSSRMSRHSMFFSRWPSSTTTKPQRYMLSSALSRIAIS